MTWYSNHTEDIFREKARHNQILMLDLLDKCWFDVYPGAENQWNAQHGLPQSIITFVKDMIKEQQKITLNNKSSNFTDEMDIILGEQTEIICRNLTGIIAHVGSQWQKKWKSYISVE